MEDFLAICLPGQSWSENEFIALTGSVGVPWSTEKTHPFSVIQRYIGFDWDLNQRSISLPDGKLITIRVLLNSWLAPHSKYSAHCTLSLHGKLVHISCIFPLIQPFLHSLSHFAGDFRSPVAKLHPLHPVVVDLEWVKQILYNILNTIPLFSPEPVDIDWWGDASTSFGVGLVIGNWWGVWRWAPGFAVGPKQKFDIGWAEAVIVKIGLQVAIEYALVNQSLGAKFLVRSDNMGIVTDPLFAQP